MKRRNAPFSARALDRALLRLLGGARIVFGNDAVNRLKVYLRRDEFSRLLCLLGGARIVFGNDAVNRLKAYRRRKLKEISRSSKRNYVVSFPTSGNHWVRFILEFFSGMPTSGIRTNPRDPPIYRNEFKSRISPLWHVQGKGTFFCHKAHLAENLKAEDCNSALLLIRAFPECVSHALLQDKSALEREARWYLAILLSYQQIDVPKMHVHYESLLREPREIIASILAFYGIDNPPLFEYFMRHYKRMQFLSKTATNRQWKRLPESGDDIFYHRKRSLGEWNAVNDFFQGICSESRYDPIRHFLDFRPGH